MTDRKKAGNVVDLRGRLGASALLDDVLDLFGNQDLDPVNALLQRGLRDFGADDLAEELSRRLVRLGPDDDSTAMVWALETVGGETVLVRMREIVTATDLPTRVRTDAALVLNAIGEPIDPSILEAEPGNVEAILHKILDETEHKLARIDAVERTFVLDEMFDEISRQIDPGQDDNVLTTLVDALAEQNRVVAADMLWVLREFSGDDNIRAASAHGLEAMRWRDVVPTPKMVAATYEGRFVQASVSDDQRGSAQTHLLLAWEQQPGHLLLLSFLIDNAFWSGAVKDFFLKPSAGADEFAAIIDVYNRQDIAMLPIDASQTRLRVQAALSANGEQVRPIPVDYRRFHNLLVHTLFQGNSPIALPTLQDEGVSPLVGLAGEVENLLRDLMPVTGFTPQQTWNGRMLWRDYFLHAAPRISKSAVWAAAVTYLIGSIEGRRDLTQPVIASQFAVSAGSVSKRAAHVRGTFLDVEQGVVAYATDRVRDGRVRDAIESIVDLPDGPGEETRERLNALNTDYQDYVSERAQIMHPPRRLDRAEFERLLVEMDLLITMEEQQMLTQGQSERLMELRHLLLLNP